MLELQRRRQQFEKFEGRTGRKCWEIRIRSQLMKQGKNTRQKHQENSRGEGMNNFMLARAYSSRIQRFCISLMSRRRNRMLRVCMTAIGGSCGFLNFIVLQITKKKKRNIAKKGYLTLRFQVFIRINALVKKVLNDQLRGYFVYIA